MNTNKRLRELRKSLGYTQKDIAQKLGLSQTGYSRIESGESEIQDYAKIILKNVLNVNIEWLSTGEGEMFTTNEIASSEKVKNEPDELGKLRAELEKLRAELEEKTAKIKADETIIMTLTKYIDDINKDNETLRQQNYNYRKPLTNLQEDYLHNKGTPKAAKKQFRPK